MARSEVMRLVAEVWVTMADPSINKDAWTETEERVMAEAHRYSNYTT